MNLPRNVFTLLCLLVMCQVQSMGINTKVMHIAGLVHGSKMRYYFHTATHMYATSSRGLYAPSSRGLMPPLHRSSIDLSATGLGASVIVDPQSTSILSHVKVLAPLQPASCTALVASSTSAPLAT